ncbi:MAG: hypothetical protein KF866_03030 [Phycisphaeraceae bacterium]|nr:hypothetical protein [Phycisphaeraceae bacterium]
MERLGSRSWLASLSMVLASGLAVSVWAVQPEAPATPSGASAPPGAGEPTHQPARIYRLNFKDQPFDQVLDFFSRETGLPIIREANVPQASMTFLSGSALSFDEALTILNLNLRMHGVHLRKEGTHLYLGSLKDSFRQPGIVADGELPPGTPDDRIITINIPLSNANAALVAEQLKPMVSDFGGIIAVPAQNMVILTESAGQIRRLSEIIRTIDSERAVDSQFRLFRLKHAKPASVVEALKGLIGVRQRQIIIDPQGKQRVVEEIDVGGVQMQPDERTNSVVVVGPRARLDIVAELIELLDAPEAAQGEQQMMTFVLRSISSQQATEHLSSLFRSVPESRRPTVLALPDVGKVTVVGQQTFLLQAAALLSEVDPGADEASPVQAERVARTIRMRYITPQAVEQLVSRLLSPRQQQMVRFAPAPDGRGLVVTGPPREVQEFVSLIEGLDVAPAMDRQVKLVRLSSNDPADLLHRVDALFAQTKPPAEGELTSSFDAASRTVTLIGPGQAIARYEQLLRSVEGVAVVDGETRTYSLSVRRASEVAEALSRLARPMLEPSDGSTYVPPRFEPLDELKKLVVRASPDQFAVIGSLIDQIDRQKPGDTEFRVIRITQAPASDVRARALDLFMARARDMDPSDIGEPIVEADDLSGNLLITARPSAMRLLHETITQAQQLLPPDRTTRLIEVRNAKAQDIIEQLNELLLSADSIDAGRRVPDASIRAVDRTNSLLVTAEAAQHAMIADFVRRLDTLDDVRLPPLRLLQLRTADAVAIGGMLQQRYDRRPQGERATMPVDIRSDGATNTLMVSAHPELFDEIKTFIEGLNEDRREGPERVTVLFTLKVARATDVAAAMDKLYPQPPMPVDRRGVPMPWLQRDKEVTVSADSSSNSLIIDAPRDRISSLEELAAKLDRVELPPVASLRTYRIVGADLTAISRTLSALANQGNLSAPAQPGKQPVRVVIETEPKSSTLIVAGDEVTFERVEQMLADLSAVPVERELRIVPLSNVEAADVRIRAMQLYDAQTAGIPDARPVEVSVNEHNNAIEVVADREGMTRFMRIVEELQRQAGPAREIRMIELRFARAADVVSFLDDLVKSSASFRSGGGADPVFEALDSTNTLLIAAQPAHLPIVDQLVRNLDNAESVERPPLRILRLRTTDAASLAAVLQGSYNRRPVEERSRKPVDVQADPATNTLVVSAHHDVLPEIESLVNELNQTQAFDAEEREIRIFPLKVARAEELAQTIDQMFPEPPIPLDPRTRQPRYDLRQPREIVVRADRATNSLIVDAPAKRLAGFEQIVRSLDQHKLAADLELRTYRLQRAELVAVAATLRQLAATGALGVPVQQGVTIESEPVTRTLIVGGPSAIFPQVEKVLGDLDAFPERPGVTLRLYPLRHARADRLQPLLEQILATRLREVELEKGMTIEEVRSMLDVAADRASNTLIVSAPESVQQIAEHLIRSLDVESARIGQSTIRVVPLTYADAGSIAQAVQQALPSIDLPSGGTVTVIAAAGANALLLSGVEEDLNRVESLLEPLDQRPAGDDVASAATFALQHAESAQIAQVVQRLLTDQLENDPRLITAQLRYFRGQLPRRISVRVEADSRTNSLIVSGPAATIELARTIINQLDQPDELGRRSVATFNPARADPQSLVQTVRNIVTASMPAARVKLELLHEPRTGSIVVIGTDEQVTQAVRMLADFDDRAIALPSVELAIFDLSNAAAASTASVMQGMLADRSRWPDELARADRAGLPIAPPRVNAEAGSNRLLVSVPAALMPLARDLITMLDAPPSGKTVELRVFNLEKGDAAGVAQALAATLRAGLRPGQREPVVTAETRSNAVLVAADPEQLASAEQMIRSLDSAVDIARAGVRTVFLKNARAESLAPIVQQLLVQEDPAAGMPDWVRWSRVANRQVDERPHVRVIAETRLNALVVSAPVSVLELAEQTIAALDIDQRQAVAARAVRVLTPTNAEAAELAVNLADLFLDDDTDGPPPVIKVDRGSNSLIVRATAEQFDRIEALVHQLDKAALVGSREMRMIRIDPSRADAASMAATLKQLLERSGGLRVEIISAEELLNERPKGSSLNSPLDDRDGKDGALFRAGFRGQDHTDLSVVPMIGVDPVSAILVAAIGMQPESDAGAVTIAVDPATNSLIVIGSPRVAERVARLAADIESQVPAQPTAVRVISLAEGAPVDGIVQIVRETIRQVGRSGPNNPGGFSGAVGITADPVGEGVIVWANDADFAVLGRLIGSLASSPRMTSLTVKVYPLENIRADRAAGSVRDLVSPRPQGRQAQRLRSTELTLADPTGREVRAEIDANLVSVTPDPSGTAIIVAAPADAYSLIDAFIALIDQSPVHDRLAIRRYELQNARASDLARTFETLFEAQRQGPSAGELPRARFVPDERTNSILVTAGDAQHAEVVRLLASADAELADRDLVTEIFTLRQASPSTVQRVIEQIVVGRDPGKRELMQVSIDESSSVVVVKAPPAQLEEVRQIIAQVDIAETGGLPVRTIKLARADASIVARSVTQFFEQRARASAMSGRRPESKVAVVGDRRSGALIIAAGDQDFAQIESMVAAFDEAAPAQEMDIRVVPLRHVRVADVRSMLENLTFELQYERMWGQAGVTGEAKLFTQFNERGNSVVFVGQGEALTTAERLVNAIDIPATEQSRKIVRAVRAEHADLNALARVIESSFASTQPRWWWGPGGDTDSVSVQVDRQRGLLLLVGVQARVDEAAEAIVALDLAAMREGQVIESITLRHAQADRAAQSLSRFFRDRAQAEGRRTDEVSIIGSPDGNVLIASAREEDMEILRALIAQLDQPELGEGRVIEAYVLRNLEPAEAAATLRAMFPQTRADERVIVTPQVSTRSVIVSVPAKLSEQVAMLVSEIDRAPTADDVKFTTVTLESARADDIAASLRLALPPTLKVTITPVSRSNSLLLTGSPEAIEIAVAQIRILDTEPPRSMQVFKRIALKHAMADDVWLTLTQIMRNRRTGPTDPAVSIDYSSADNTLSISATPDQIEQIEQMIAELDVPVAVNRTTEFVKLQYADAEQTAKALQVFYGRSAREARTPGARATTIVPDPASNSLVISADINEWEGIRSLIRKLDSAEYDTSRQLAVIPLVHADAVSVARALSEGFRQGVDRQLSQERARIEQQRRRAPAGREDDFFDPLVLVQDDAIPSVSAEPTTNSLIVFASPRDMQRIQAIVMQLDVPDVLKLPQPRVIPLENGRASQIAQALREMFVSQGGRQQNLRGVMIFGDDVSNTIIVRANDEQFAQILQLAQTLQNNAAQARLSPRVVSLRHVPAVRLRETLTATFRPIAAQRNETFSIELDRAGNALVIVAGDRLFEEIESVVKQLDAVDYPPETAPEGDAIPQPGPGQGVYIIDVVNNSPDDIRQVLEQMGVTRATPADRPGVVSEPVTLVSLKQRKALAVVGSRADGEAIRRLISALDAEILQPAQHVEVLFLKLADARAIAQTLRDMLNAPTSAAPGGQPSALAEQIRRLAVATRQWDRPPVEVDLSLPIRIIPDPQTNSITIASTRENVAALIRVVELFDTLPIGDAVVIRLFPLQNASAARLKTVIDELFRQGEALRRLPGTQRQGLPSTVTGRALAGEVAVSIDERTNTLVVAGREEAVALVEVILKDLDAQAVASWVEPQIIPLKHADPVRMAQKLREVLVTGISQTPEAAALRRQVARLRIARTGGDAARPGAVEADIFAPLSDLVITAEENLGAIIVVGSTSNVRVVRELVAMLDVEAAAAGNEVRIFPMRFAAADRVARIAQDVFSQRERAGGLRPEDRLIITTDTRTNALVVSTSPRSLAVLESLLRTLDAEQANLSVGIHVLAVPDVDVRQLAPRIQRLMQERLAASRRAGVPESPSDAVSIEPEPASGSLIIAASDENLEVIRELLSALTRAGAEGGGLGAPRTEVIPIPNGQVEDIFDSINELYVRRENEKRGAGSVIVSANARLNAVVVTGTEADILAIRSLIQSLGTADVRIQQDIRRIELKTANALEVVNLLEAILAGRPIGGGLRQGAAARQAVRIRFFRDQVADVVEHRTGREPTEAEIDGAIRDQVRLTPDLRTNSVMVSAPPQLMRLIEEIITDLDTTTAGNRQIEVFLLKNADADAMAALLRDLFNLRQSGDNFVLLPTRGPQDEPPPDGARLFGGTTVTPVPDQRQELAITVDPRTNSLLVSGTREYLDLVRRVVNELDSVEATERDRIVYHLRNAKADEVAQTLRTYFREEIERVRATLRSDQLGSVTRQLEQEVTIVGDQKSNKLVISAAPRYIEAVRSIIEELDAAPPQVVIQVLLAEVTLDSEDTWGTDFRVGPIGGDNFIFGSTPAGAAVSAAIGLPQLTVSSGDFSVLIRSLQAKGRLEVLSRPEVTVNNNEAAYIQVGENIAILDGVTTFDTGRTQANVRREDVGIILDVTPSISSDGFVRMEIRPSISAVTARTTQVSEDFNAPIISRREVETTVTVKDGQTIVIGGLIQTTDEERASKVPILGDIPGVGELFKTRERSRIKTELLVILTPRVIPGTRPADVARQKAISDQRIEEMTSAERIRAMVQQTAEEVVRQAQAEAFRADAPAADAPDADNNPISIQPEPAQPSPSKPRSGWFRQDP